MANANYISQIVVDGVTYEILSKYDNPVRFMGQLPGDWTDDPHNTTGDVSVSPAPFTPEKGHMVITKNNHREYVCIDTSIDTSTGLVSATWALMGSVKQSTGTIYGVSSDAHLNTHTVLDGLGTLGVAPAITSVSVEESDKAEAVIGYDTSTTDITVFNGDPETTDFSKVTDVSRQVVTAYTDTSMSVVINATLSNGGVTDNKGTVITALSGNNTTHKTGTITTTVTQTPVSAPKCEVVSSITLPTLNTEQKSVLSGFTQGTISSPTIPVVTAVRHTGIDVGKATAITEVTIDNGADTTIEVLKDVKVEASLTPAEGQVIDSFTPDSFDSDLTNVVATVSQAVSTKVNAVTSLDLPTLTGKTETTVVTSIGTGNLVTDVTKTGGFVTSVSVNSGNVTSSNSLFSVNTDTHVLTLVPNIAIVTDVSLTPTYGSAITNVGTSAQDLGTVEVVKSFTWGEGSKQDGSVIVAVGEVTHTDVSVVATVSHTPASVTTGTIVTSYELNNQQFNTATVVNQSGTRTLDTKTYSFVTGITSQGTVSVDTANVVQSVTLSSGTPHPVDINHVTNWNRGGSTPCSVVSEVTGGVISNVTGTIVTEVTDSSISGVTGSIVTSTTYTSQIITASKGTITYLNGATLGTVNVIATLDNNHSAVTAVPRATKTVVTGGIATKGKFATKVTTDSSIFVQTIPGSTCTVVTSITPVPYTVVTAAEEPNPVV